MFLQDLMTAEEERELLDRGWQPEVITALRARGFRPIRPESRGMDPVDAGRAMGFLRHSVHPQLRITVEMDSDPQIVMTQIDTAIYEHGRDRAHAYLAGQFMSFFRMCEKWDQPPSDLEQRVAALEARSAPSDG